MKILVTGAAGFVGSNLCRRLLEDGHKVSGVDNLSFGSFLNIKELIKHPSYTFIEGDVRKAETIFKINSDIIVHLASQKIPRYTNALVTLTDNSEMLKNVVQRCVETKQKLVFASTSDVYGKNPNIPFHENSDLVLGPTTVKRWAYALSKIYAEQYILANNDEYGLEFSIMRFFGSYGPNQNITWWGGPQSVFIQNILENKPVEIHGDGSQTRTFTYIEDLCDGIMKCIFHENSKNEIFNIANEPDEEVTINDLAALICELMADENKPEINYIPYKTFGNYEDVKRRVPDITKIKTLLGFQPKYPLREGLQLTIDWQKKIQGSYNL